MFDCCILLVMLGERAVCLFMCVHVFVRCIYDIIVVVMCIVVCVMRAAALRHDRRLL